MSEKKHWPFGPDADEGEARRLERERERELEREQSRMATNAAHQQHLRNDRLLVGGRAHSKQRGLS